MPTPGRSRAAQHARVTTTATAGSAACRRTTSPLAQDQRQLPRPRRHPRRHQPWLGLHRLRPRHRHSVAGSFSQTAAPIKAASTHPLALGSVTSGVKRTPTRGRRLVAMHGRMTTTAGAASPACRRTTWQRRRHQRHRRLAAGSCSLTGALLRAASTHPLVRGSATRGARRMPTQERHPAALRVRATTMDDVA